jgi:hypothetical protein
MARTATVCPFDARPAGRASMTAGQFGFALPAGQILPSDD